MITFTYSFLLITSLLISFIYEDIWESEMVKDETADCETYLLPYDDLSVQLVNLQVRSILILADALIQKSSEKNRRNINIFFLFPLYLKLFFFYFQHSKIFSFLFSE